MGSFSLKEVTLSLTFRREKVRSVRQAFHLTKQLQGFLVSNEIKIIALKLSIFGGHNHFRLTHLFLLSASLNILVDFPRNKNIVK